jgi:hypothetical protein
MYKNSTQAVKTALFHFQGKETRNEKKGTKKNNLEQVQLKVRYYIF